MSLLQTSRPSDFARACRQLFWSVVPSEFCLLMDLFHYSMYQFAFSAEYVAAEELATAHHFLAGWLHHHAYLAADQELRPELRLVEDLNLDPLGRLEMVVDVETYYNVLLSDAEIGQLRTIRDVERCLGQQLAHAA